MHWDAILGVGCAAGMAVALFLTHGAGEKSGRAEVQAEWNAAQASDANTRADRMEAAAKAMQAAGEAFEAKATNIRTTYRLIEKETSRAITPEIDARYPLPWVYVRLLDAAAAGVPPGPPAVNEPDGEPSGLSLTAGVATGVANGEACALTRQQLIDLQGVIRAQPGY